MYITVDKGHEIYNTVLHLQIQNKNIDINKPVYMDTFQQVQKQLARFVGHCC